VTIGGGVTPEEFDAFYERSVRRLIGVLYVLTGDSDEARDVVQEAFVRAWSKRRTLARVDHPEAWVRTVAWRLAISRWRKNSNARTAWQRRADLEPGYTAGPDVENLALRDALQQLPVDQRTAIVLHHLCDLPVQDVAAEVGSPVGTVKARLSRGRAALAELLRDPTLVAATASDGSTSRGGL
jgi:RNA polymerase sigma-70 factor, ECF subfamily